MSLLLLSKIFLCFKNHLFLNKDKLSFSCAFFCLFWFLTSSFSFVFFHAIFYSVCLSFTFMLKVFIKYLIFLESPILNCMIIGQKFCFLSLFDCIRCIQWQLSALSPISISFPSFEDTRTLWFFANKMHQKLCLWVPNVARK